MKKLKLALTISLCLNMVVLLLAFSVNKESEKLRNVHFASSITGDGEWDWMGEESYTLDSNVEPISYTWEAKHATQGSFTQVGTASTYFDDAQQLKSTVGYSGSIQGTNFNFKLTIKNSVGNVMEVITRDILATDVNRETTKK